MNYAIIHYNRNKLLPLPEAIFYVLQTKISTKEKLFQRMMVEVQTAMENAVDKCIEPGKIILCHRGSLDPLAYWLNNGWEENDFFTITQKSIDEYFSKYYAVVHLETSAINAKDHYKSYPDAHRHESAEQAAKIDALLVKAWNGYPNFYFIESSADWSIKEDNFNKILKILLLEK